MGDPLLVVFEAAISQHVFHNCVPYCCDVLVSLLIDGFVFCFVCRSIEWVDECVYKHFVECVSQSEICTSLFSGGVDGC